MVPIPFHPRSISARCSGIAREIITPIRIKSSSLLSSVPQIFHNTKAIWDTGATNSVISSTLAKEMGLIPIGKANTIGVHGQNVVDRYLVDVEIMQKVIIVNLEVSSGIVGPDGNQIGFLVGMDIIAQGDFALTMENRKSVFTFRFPSKNQAIDFVKMDTEKTETIPDRAPLNRHERRFFEKRRRHKKK